MKKLLLFFMVVILFLVTFVVSFPKDRLYALMQNELQKKSVQLSSRELNSHLLSLELKENSVSYENIKILNIDYAKFSFVGVNIRNISSDGTFETIFPNIKSVDIRFKTGRFLDIKSSIANAKGMLDLKNRTLNIVISPKSQEFLNYKMLLKKLKKEGGNYVFKYSF